MHRYESRDQALGNQHNKTEASEEADGAPKVENSLGLVSTHCAVIPAPEAFLFVYCKTVTSQKTSCFIPQRI
jgi:hypothetical protein